MTQRRAISRKLIDSLRADKLRHTGPRNYYLGLIIALIMLAYV
jgi:hypothetical protein